MIFSDVPCIGCPDLPEQLAGPQRTLVDHLALAFGDESALEIGPSVFEGLAPIQADLVETEERLFRRASRLALDHENA